MIDKRLPLFKIASDIFSSVSFEDIMKTATDMDELGLFKPPYEEMCIQAKGKLLDQLMLNGVNKKDIANVRPLNPKVANYDFLFQYKWIDGHKKIEIETFIDRENGYYENAIDLAPPGKDTDRFLNVFAKQGRSCAALLVVLLATKNIKKDVETCNKPNSRNRRERKLSQYSSVTTISIGKITETMRSGNGSGSPVRPHLRRGHIRSQHHGKGNSEVKKIFIQPVFVNADQGWIDTQKEYRVVA